MVHNNGQNRILSCIDFSLKKADRWDEVQEKCWAYKINVEYMWELCLVMSTYAIAHANFDFPAENSMKMHPF